MSAVYSAEIFSFGNGCQTALIDGLNCLNIFLANNDTEEELFLSMNSKLSSRNTSYENVGSFVMQNLENNTLITHIPLRLFPNLRFVTIEGTEITVIAVDDLANAKDLTTCRINNSKLRRVVAGTFQSSKLQLLDLESNMIEVIDDFSFANLSALGFITLAKNKLTTINRNTFSGLISLGNLDLGKNRIHTIENGAFADLNGLNLLFLNQNNLKEIKDQLFDRLTKLVLLNASYNQIESIGDSLYPLSSLESLYLDNNLINDIDLVQLAKLPKLLRMHLNKTGLKLKNYNACLDCSWSSMSPLEYLNLQSNNLISVASLEVLRIFPNLTELDLSDNEIYVEKERLRSFLPKLNVLKL